MSAMSDQNLQEVFKLKRKAEINRQSHMMVAKCFSTREASLRFLNIILSCLVAVLIFADWRIFLPLLPSLTETKFNLTNGILASLVFILTILEYSVRWDDVSEEHQKAVKDWTALIRKLSKLKEQESVSPNEVELILNEYVICSESTPVIPDRFFYKGKRSYFQKKQISKMVDKQAFTPVWYLRVLSFKESRRGGSFLDS